MSTLIRNDGAVFLIQVYREQIEQQSPKRMREALRRLSAKQGRYLHVSGSKVALEVALDKSVGFLLGESLVKHFKDQPSFIYMERMEKINQVLVVVAREQKILLDTLVSNDEIWPELLPLVAGETRYPLFYSGFNGSLPLDFPNNGSTATSTAEMLAQATSIPNSLFDLLPLYVDLQLVPCEKAIQQSHIRGVTNKTWGVISAVCLIVTFAFAIQWVDHVNAPKAGKKSPYVGYYKGIAEQPASQVVESVIHALTQVFALPSIQLHRIEYHNRELELKFIGDNEKLAPLLSWSKQNNFHFSVHSSNVRLTQKQQFKPVSLNNKIYSATQVYVYLSDHLRSMHPGSGFRLSSSQSKKGWKTLICEWHVAGLTAADLNWLHKLLKQSPVSCDRISLAYRDGVMQGNIHLKIWGTQ